MPRPEDLWRVKQMLLDKDKRIGQLEQERDTFLEHIRQLTEQVTALMAERGPDAAMAG